MLKKNVSLKKVRRTIKQWVEPLGPKVVILLYHRIADVDRDPQLLSVKPGNFSAHLDYLRRSCKVISLTELGQALKKRKLPRRAVVITFDDGYRDNLQHGKPLLEQYGLPATVFVTAGYLGQQREFWWDELERILLGGQALPESLYLDIHGKTLEWHLGGDDPVRLSGNANIQGWSVLEKADPTVYHQAYRELCGWMRPMPAREQDDVLSALRSWADMPNAGRPDYRVTTEDELRNLASGGLMEIGAHTMTHQHLAAQPPIVQKEEIFESKTRLEVVLGKAVNSFAYPFGAPRDYTPETVEFVRAAGYTQACSNFPRTVKNETSCFELPRFLVRDWSVQTFASTLKGWFGD